MDKKYMQRCLQLANNGLGNTYTNPMVGSVIVYNDKIIGEGFHHKAGEPHAEVNAINSVYNKELLPKSTLYVNLEPCAHYGKTPPCSLLIKECKIPRVVIGCTDTFSKVAGNGIKLLKESGVDVEVGVLEEESRELNKRFFTYHEKKRPYVILKWAQTQDGYIDIDRNEDNYGRPTWITNSLAKKLVHKWRSQEQSILVGTNTAIKDNPSLTTREWAGNSPIRLLLDRKRRVPTKHKLLNGKEKTMVFSEKNYDSETNVNFVTIDFNNDITSQVLDKLYKINIQSVIIEGGMHVLQSFIDSNLWDEARVFIGNKIFKSGIHAPRLNKIPFNEEVIGDCSLLFYRNM